jgi:hypothetical protein
MLETKKLFEKLDLMVSAFELQSKDLQSLRVQLNQSRNHELIPLLERLHRLPVLSDFNPQNTRNFLPNDSAALQINLMLSWRAVKDTEISFNEILDSGFRVFSQNDEDGILLRIFSHIETTNKYVVEIGSNCSGSDLGIPENMSTNLLVNHGWHGSIFEADELECSKMVYFFATHLSTRHFHYESDGINGYYSPQVIQGAIDHENINIKMKNARVPLEPDLMVVDIDGDDFSIVKALKGFSPRVLVVEFEKRFRDKSSVFQDKSENFSVKWAQSGSTSLAAWEWLLNQRDYSLCAVNTSGFNAFFVRTDVAEGKLNRSNAKEIFDRHPIFSNSPEDFWLEPDETWVSTS